MRKPSSPFRPISMGIALACVPACADMLGYEEISFQWGAPDASVGDSASPDQSSSDSPADIVTPSLPACPDGTCGDEESCVNCPADCGVCPPPAGCPDGTCGDGESCSNCPADCGDCPVPACPDGTCSVGENCSTCPADCGNCPPAPVCSDGACNGSEDCATCPGDCGACAPGCPDGICNGAETCSTCAQDCGGCPTACPDGACNGGETCGSCPADCGQCPPGCPDGACNGGETCGTCAADCGNCPPVANDDPSRLLVYTINYENLMKATSSGDPAECQGDWTELIDQIAGTLVAPDIVLIQQMSGKNGYGSSPVETVEAALAARFPGQSWNTIVAETQPAVWANANCPAKTLQTNGIMYRTARLDYVQNTKKTLMARINDNGSCPEAKLSRNLGVFAKFGDRANGTNSSGGYVKELAIGSVHWPVEDGCGVTNANQTDTVMMSYTGAQMYLWGGDINLPDRDAEGWMPWYLRANGDFGPDTLGYRDPIFQACGGQEACLDANATLKIKRYDFLFAKYKSSYKLGMPMTGGQWTVPWDPDGDGLKYSMHKAVKSFVYW